MTVSTQKTSIDVGSPEAKPTPTASLNDVSVTVDISSGAPAKKPKIYICPTLYRETYDEMSNLVKSVKILDLDTHHATPESLFDLEVNVFFDKCFEHSSGSASLNDHGVRIDQVLRDNFEGLEDPIKVATPYGMQLEYFLPTSGTKFTVHFKDHLKIQAGKRFSQCLYFMWLLLCKNKDATQAELRSTYILALDGDSKFKPKVLKSVLAKIETNPRYGVICGRIMPTGNGPIAWYQTFEYAIGQWLQKATEDIMGSVLCSPGCFSLYRAEAVLQTQTQDWNPAIEKYCRTGKSARSYIQRNMGEDRWMCTLLISRGWQVGYDSLALIETACPEGLAEFLKQRRRWGPSFYLNIYDLFVKGREITKISKKVTWFFILYEALYALTGFTACATMLLFFESFSIPLLNLPEYVGMILAFSPFLILSVACLTLKDDHQQYVAKFTFLYYSVVQAFLFGIIIYDMTLPDGICQTTNQVFLLIAILYFLTWVLHLNDAYPWKRVVYCGLVYAVFAGPINIVINVYQFCNLNVVSWGTREAAGTSNKAFDGEIDEDCEKKDTKPLEADLMVASTKTLPNDEVVFFKNLIEKDLKLINTTDEERRRLKSSLDRIRNRVCFAFFFCNIMTIVTIKVISRVLYHYDVLFDLPNIIQSCNTLENEQKENGQTNSGVATFDPVTLIFLLYNLAIVGITILGMLIHRVRTFSLWLYLTVQSHFTSKSKK